MISKYVFFFTIALISTIYGAKCPLPVPPYTCPITKNIRLNPTAQRLHPSDISLVAAMGDSITAGLFMRVWKNPFTIRMEHRSHSYSNGVKIDSIFSNIAKYHNHVDGASKKATRVYSYSGGGNGGYNFAVTAASIDQLKVQVEHFINKLVVQKQSRNPKWYNLFLPKPSFDVNDRWIMLNIWMGAIDLCSLEEADFFEKNLREGLAILHKNVKQVFVNLVLHPDITAVHEVTKNNKWCRSVQRVLQMCPPMFESRLKEDRETMKRLRLDYNDVMINVASDYARINDPQFMVVAQGGLVDVDLSPFRTSEILSLYDCFHPNVCSNRNFAFRLWNSLFTPLKDDLKASLINSWKCPTEQDYFQ